MWVGAVLVGVQVGGWVVGWLCGFVFVCVGVWCLSIWEQVGRGCGCGCGRALV